MMVLSWVTECITAFEFWLATFTWVRWTDHNKTYQSLTASTDPEFWHKTSPFSEDTTFNFPRSRDRCGCSFRILLQARRRNARRTSRDSSTVDTCWKIPFIRAPSQYSDCTKWYKCMEGKEGHAYWTDTPCPWCWEREKLSTALRIISCDSFRGMIRKVFAFFASAFDGSAIPYPVPVNMNILLLLKWRQKKKGLNCFKTTL